MPTKTHLDIFTGWKVKNLSVKEITKFLTYSQFANVNAMTAGGWKVCAFNVLFPLLLLATIPSVCWCHANKIILAHEKAWKGEIGLAGVKFLIKFCQNYEKFMDSFSRFKLLSFMPPEQFLCTSTLSLWHELLKSFKWCVKSDSWHVSQSVIGYFTVTEFQVSWVGNVN